ncbi:GAF domain-containing protein [Actinoplanes sp. NPDC051851]|uniref:GAF domain-containing protein n=1 Tax=Actinoplanes sp. NPDC051851 TaxID=3154753 RepID=UPI003432FAEB
MRSTARLRDVARLGLDRELHRDYLGDVVDTVAAAMDTPFALVDILLDDAQVILAGHGPVPEWVAEAGGTPIEWAFCGMLLFGSQARAVPDLAADPRFRDNPLVTVEGFRSYVGAPLFSSTGHVLGGLCALDTRPRAFPDDDLVFLAEMADEAVRRIELHATPPP